MKYFYLSPDRTPQGPYDAAELKALRASGAIDDDTLSAVAGDAAWRPLRELNLGEDAGAAVPPPVGPRTLGNCPFCGQEIVGTETPAECPHCNKTLHPGTGNLWLNFISCLRRYACFRGRAGRTEFWSFYLFYFLITYVAEMLIELALATQFGFPPDLREQLRGAADLAEMRAMLQPHLATCIGGTLAEYGVGLLFLLPYLAVTVRRLHDTGRSAAALLWYFLGMVLCIGTVSWVAWFLWNGPWKNEIALEQLMKANLDVVTGVSFAMAAGLITQCISALYILVCLLLPTKKGGNKYGPSL